MRAESPSANATGRELAGALNCYVQNRTEFYESLIPRIPDPRLRDLFARAVTAFDPSETRLDPVCPSSNKTDQDYLSSLISLDMFKKPSYGRAAGRTVISLHEALLRAQQIESNGILLLQNIVHENPQMHDELASCRSSLEGLQKLQDDLRYHKLSPTTLSR
jgi:hypothetical protein